MNGHFKEALESELRMDAPPFHLHHAWLAAIYGRLGRLDEARAEAAEVRRLRPDFDLAAHYRRSNMPEQNIRKLMAGARKAGLV
jgi:adenylate cyclase